MRIPRILLPDENSPHPHFPDPAIDRHQRQSPPDHIYGVLEDFPRGQPRRDDAACQPPQQDDTHRVPMVIAYGVSHNLTIGTKHHGKPRVTLTGEY